MEIRNQRLSIPAELLHCVAEPAIPDLRTQRDVALYVIDLRQYGRDCESKLRAVRDLQTETEQNQ